MNYNSTNCIDCGFELREEVVKGYRTGKRRPNNQKLTRLICDACGHTESGLKRSEKEEMFFEYGNPEQEYLDKVFHEQNNRMLINDITKHKHEE